MLFPTCQVKVVRFYVSCLLVLLLFLSSSFSSSSASFCLVLLSSSSSSSPRRPCSTATRDPQCSLLDLNYDHPRPVFPAGPQLRPSAPQCSLPDLNHDHPRPVFPAGPHVGRYGTKNVQTKVRKNGKNVRRYARRYAR